MPRRQRPPSRSARKPRAASSKRKNTPAPRGKPGPSHPPAQKHGHKHAAGFTDPHAEREAQRYEHPIPSREAILALLAERGSLLRIDDIATALGIDDGLRREALDKRLRAMLRDGQLLQSRRGGLAPAERIGLIAGTVLANAEGYGFLRPDEGGDDLYLSPAQMRQVLHGDRVLASVVGVDRRGRQQGAIREVLERRAPRLVGRVVEAQGVVVVDPDDRRLHQDVLIPPDARNGARAGQIVVAEITEPPTEQRGPIGRIVSVLGERLQPSLIVEMAIESHGLPHVWPQDVVRESEAVEPNVTDTEYAGRVDLRNVPLVTIDGADSRDFDDAVYAEPVRGGGFKLIVAIADVSHYVEPETALDTQAYERGTSVYFPGFVVPMLPETLSNGICSLNPDVDRLCMACEMRVGPQGDVTRAKFYPAVMRSHARLTYDQVWQAIGERDAGTRRAFGKLLPHIDNLHALYKAFAAARRRRGTIDFETGEVDYRLDEQGNVVSLGAHPRNDAHKLIEECMVAANVQAARFLAKKKIPAPFRVHAPPPADKYEDLLAFLREYKLKLPPVTEVKPRDFAALLQRVASRPDAELFRSVLLRAQSMASYLPSNHGHFGLALDAYAHFTSPIRRYPDLLVHRAIRYALAGGKPAAYLYTESKMAGMAAHCSRTERRAEEAERDVDERYKCAWMEQHVGAEFDGIVTGVTSFGLFVELTESKVSGLVHITQLRNDYYHFDARRHELRGERTGSVFRLGDAVRVQVLRASMEDRRIDFRMVRDDDKPMSGERHHRRR
ncbi:MAG TPA: ribonuclease R [Rhodanobacteraceae bacterium]|nr:ribonuclease R [Rhodanobacteraceae bacterium]